MMNFKDLVFYDKNGEMMDLDEGAEYFNLVSRKEVLAHMCLMPIGYSDSKLYNEVYGFPSKHSPYYDSWRSIYCDKRTTEFEKNEANIKADSDPKYYDKILGRCLKDGEDLANYADSLKNIDFSGKSDAELKEYANNLFEKLRLMSVYLLFPISLQNHIEDRLRELINKNVNDEDGAQEYFQSLTVP